MIKETVDEKKTFLRRKVLHGHAFHKQTNKQTTKKKTLQETISCYANHPESNMYL